MHRLAVPLALSFAFAFPAAAQTLLSEASGNWAGPSNQGLYFLARLTQVEDKARLTIWGGAMDAVQSDEGEPDFDNAEIELGAFATRQALEVLEGPDGSILQIVTEFADEDAEGRSVLQLQFLDNQYTVVGYYHLSNFHAHGGEPSTYECDVDLQSMTSTENGLSRPLEPVSSDALNASDWSYDAAFDRGYCSRS